MILGLTNNEHGESIQRLAIAVKVAIGLGPDEKKGRKAPQKLDHFVFQTRSTATDSGWDEDSALTIEMEKHYNKNPREIEIVFLDDDIENVFRTSYAWWSAARCECSGQLMQIQESPAKFAMQAIRKTERHPEGEPWPGSYKYSAGDKKGQQVPGCGDGCPDLEEGRCKPSADLLFVSPKHPVLGATWKIHTTSYNSIRNISASLQQIRMMTGGRLAGIPLRLRVDPQKISYAGDDAKQRRSTAHILNITFRAEDLQRLISGANQHAELFHQSRKYLGPSKVVIVDDPESEQTRMMGEFRATADDAEVIDSVATDSSDEAADTRVEQPEPVSEDRPTSQPAKDVIDPTLNNSIHDLCQQLGMNRAAYQSLVGQWRGKLPELETKLKADIKAKNSPANHPPKTEAAAAKPANTSVPPPQPTGAKSNAEPYLDF